MTSGAIQHVIPERGFKANARSAIERDLLLLENAALLIVELGERLDRELEREARPSERLRFVREATVRITRTANDAIQAYRRTRRLLDASAAGPTGDPRELTAMQTRLSAHRLALLAVLDTAKARYPEVTADSDIPA